MKKGGAKRGAERGSEAGREARDVGGGPMTKRRLLALVSFRKKGVSPETDM